MIGERLAELRESRGLNQKELSSILGVSKNSISKYENDRSTPDDETKIKIAEYFNVSLDYLMGTIRDQVPIHQTSSLFLYCDNLPEGAKRELDSFLQYLRQRYHL